MQQQEIYKQKWTSPDGATKNQIDRELTGRRHFSTILDARSFRDANITSDHNLVRARLRCRISSSNTKINTKQRRINIEALKTPTTAQRFEECITLKLNSIPENPDIDSDWNACVEEWGQQEQTRTKGWRDAEYDMAVATKEESYLQLLQSKTRASLEEFRIKRMRFQNYVYKRNVDLTGRTWKAWRS